jgi:meso-butanediol dehydrogenase/(S,S)-butanediol dehydrogenase/diacetyl reductase
MSVAVVTGGVRGLGRGIALALADAGHDLVVGYASDAAAARETAEAITARGRRAEIVAGDVRDPATSKLLVDAATATLGGLDVWVNNAGVSLIASVADTPPAEMERMLAVNVMGTLHGLQAAAATMRGGGEGAGGGRIVNVASDAGLQGFALLGGYAATKFAVVGLTQTAALELAADGITVNAVCPGTAETAMNEDEWATETALTGRTRDAVREDSVAAIPLGRFCTPEDVGSTVAWLVSPGAAFVTGQSVCVNGGMVLR